MEVHIVIEDFGFRTGTSVRGRILIVPVSRAIPLKLVVFNDEESD